jgi:hypothetical protein
MLLVIQFGARFAMLLNTFLASRRIPNTADLWFHLRELLTLMKVREARSC